MIVSQCFSKSIKIHLMPFVLSADLSHVILKNQDKKAHFTNKTLFEMFVCACLQIQNERMILGCSLRVACVDFCVIITYS